MTVVVVVLVALLALAAFGGRQHAEVRTKAGGQRRAAAKPLSPYWYVVAAVVAVVLLRFGLSWLALAGGVVLAAARSLAPLLRLLPLAESLRGANRAAGSPGARPAGSAGRRSSGEAWSGAGSGAGRSQRMTRQEALQVLGLDESASAEDVQREYRRLMRKIHPDLGGSSYLAAKLNEARDVLS